MASLSLWMDERHMQVLQSRCCGIFFWEGVLHMLLQCLKDCQGVLATKWVSAIETVSPHLVMQIIANGEPANTAIKAIIEGMYKHIIVSFCIVYCLNNLRKDIGVLSWITPIMLQTPWSLVFSITKNCATSLATALPLSILKSLTPGLHTASSK